MVRGSRLSEGVELKPAAAFGKLALSGFPKTSQNSNVCTTFLILLFQMSGLQLLVQRKQTACRNHSIPTLPWRLCVDATVAHFTT